MHNSLRNSLQKGFDPAMDSELEVGRVNPRLAGICGVKWSKNLKPVGRGDGGEDRD